jgi:hypothetical protein
MAWARIEAQAFLPAKPNESEPRGNPNEPNRRGIRTKSVSCGIARMNPSIALAERSRAQPKTKQTREIAFFQ